MGFLRATPMRPGSEATCWGRPPAVLFFMLAYGDFTGGSKVPAGYVGIFCGLSAFYTAIAQILNEVYGRQVLPL